MAVSISSRPGFQIQGFLYSEENMFASWAPSAFGKFGSAVWGYGIVVFSASRTSAWEGLTSSQDVWRKRVREQGVLELSLKKFGRKGTREDVPGKGCNTCKNLKAREDLYVQDMSGI